MGYFLRVATPPAPFEADECGFPVVLDNKMYVRGGSGRLYVWDGIATIMTLVADAPGSASGLTDLCVHSGYVFGAGLDGYLYRWNGLSPSVSKGGSGQWVAVGSLAFPLYCVGSHEGSLYVGTAYDGSLYRWTGTSLIPLAGPVAGQTELHYLASFNGILYAPTAYDALLVKYQGSSLIDLTPATHKYLGQEILYTLSLGADGFIYAGSCGDGYLFRWNGVDGWEKAAECPADWTGLKNIHFTLAFGEKIYFIEAKRGALLSYNTRTGETRLEAGPSVNHQPTLGLAQMGGKIYTINNSIFEFIDTVTDFPVTVNQGDVRLHWELDGMDVAIVDADLERDEGLETSIIISLFTNRRADNIDKLPGSDSDPFQTREGWWADNQMGSKLWLLRRSKTLPDVLSLAEQYTREALAWMLEDGVATTVDVVATRYDMQTLLLSISILRPAGVPVYYKYYYNWQNQLFRRV